MLQDNNKKNLTTQNEDEKGEEENQASLPEEKQLESPAVESNEDNAPLDERYVNKAEVPLRYFEL